MMQKSVPVSDVNDYFSSHLSERRSCVSQYIITPSTSLIDARPSLASFASSRKYASTFGAHKKSASVRPRGKDSRYIMMNILEKVDPNMVPYFRRLTRMQRVYALEMDHWGRRDIREYVSAEALAGDKVRGEKTNVPCGTMGWKVDDAQLNADYDAFDVEVGGMVQSTALRAAKEQFAETSGAEYDASKGVRAAVDEAIRSKNVEVLTSLRHMFARLGYFALAESASQRTLTICQVEFSQNNPKVLDSAHGLGIALLKQGLAADAEEFLRKAASCRIANMDSNPSSEDQTVKPAVESLIALSLSLAQQGRLREAGAQIGRAKELTLALREDDVLFLRASSEMGMILTRCGRLAEAEALLAPLSDQFVTVCGAAHPDTLHNASNLAALLVQLGKHEEAVLLAKQTLATLQESLGDLHVDTLRLMRFLAIITDSSDLFQQLLVLWRKKYGADHIQYYGVIMDIGTLAARNGNLAEARASFEIAYAGFQKLLGSYHRTTTVACSKIGDTFIEEAIPRDDVAEWYVRTVFSSVECNFGVNHIETRKAANNVAVNLFRRVQSNESLEWFKKYILTWAQELSTLTSTMDDALCYLALHNYARLLTHMNMNDPSVEELRRTIWKGWARILGEEHPNTVMAIFSLGETLRDVRKLPEAESILRRAWETRKTIFGDEDPDTLEAEFGLAASLKLSLCFAESKVLHDHAYAHRLQILGEHHSDTLNSQYYLALWYEGKNNPEEAKRIQELCVAGYEQGFGPDHYWTLNALNTLGIFSYQLDTNETLLHAHECFTRAYHGLEKMFGHVHEEPLRPLVLLAQCTSFLGDAPASHELYLRALSISEQIYGPNSPSTIHLICVLVAAYFDAGMPDKGEEYYEWILRGWESIKQQPAAEMRPDEVVHLNTIRRYVKQATEYKNSSTMLRVLSRFTSRTLATVERFL